LASIVEYEEATVRPNLLHADARALLARELGTATVPVDLHSSSSVQLELMSVTVTAGESDCRRQGSLDCHEASARQPAWIQRQLRTIDLKPALATGDGKAVLEARGGIGCTPLAVRQFESWSGEDSPQRGLTRTAD